MTFLFLFFYLTTKLSYHSKNTYCVTNLWSSSLHHSYH